MATRAGTRPLARPRGERGVPVAWCARIGMYLRDFELPSQSAHGGGIRWRQKEPTKEFLEEKVLPTLISVPRSLSHQGVGSNDPELD